MSGWEAMQQGAPDPFFVSVPLPKKCKSGRHMYYGSNRCPACKKEYDARWERSAKGRRTRHAYRMRKKHLSMMGRGVFVSGMPSPPLFLPKPRIVSGPIIQTTGI